MKIDYYILPEVLEEISELDSDTFMKEYNDIEGQFMLKIGSSEIGYVDKNIPFGDELLMSWFESLTHAVSLFLESGYVIFWAVGYNFWIEFQRREDKSYIRFKKPIENHIDYLISSQKTDSFEKLKQENLSDIRFEEKQVFDEVLRTSKSFINDIEKVNYKLAECEPMKKLKQNIDFISSHL